MYYTTINKLAAVKATSRPKLLYWYFQYSVRSWPIQWHTQLAEFNNRMLLRWILRKHVVFTSTNTRKHIQRSFYQQQLYKSRLHFLFLAQFWQLIINLVQRVWFRNLKVHFIPVHVASLLTRMDATLLQAGTACKCKADDSFESPIYMNEETACCTMIHI